MALACDGHEHNPTEMSGIVMDEEESPSTGSFSKSFKRALGMPEDASSRDVPRFSVLASAGVPVVPLRMRPPPDNNVIFQPAVSQDAEEQQNSMTDVRGVPYAKPSLSNESFSKSFKQALGIPEGESSKGIPRYSVLASAAVAESPVLLRPR
mmetsp:Transcript_3811/g.10001  ORF Transcript_3811/g.10001 Transcript_3811/m.10001 type:complete len:152 (-) Transcript_3811:345-800(-)